MFIEAILGYTKQLSRSWHVIIIMIHTRAPVGGFMLDGPGLGYDDVVDILAYY